MAKARGKNKFVFFIGVDVSKDTLDFTVIKGRILIQHRCISNTHDAIGELISDLKAIANFKLSNAVFGLEKTGIYSNRLLNALTKFKANIVIENPLLVKPIRGKTDKIDSQSIANHLRKNNEELRIWRARRPIIDHLASLMSLRERLVKTRYMLTVPLNEAKAFMSEQITKSTITLCQESIDALKQNLKAVDESLDSLCKTDALIDTRMKQMLSVHGIGKITALNILISTNEFISISDPRKYASYCGIAPFPKQSGTTLITTPKISRIANTRIKALLYVCVMTTLKGNTEFNQYYRRKVDVDKKPKMKVINALKFKLILRVFACVNENRLFEVNYNQTNRSIINKDVEHSV